MEDNLGYLVVSDGNHEDIVISYNNLFSDDGKQLAIKQITERIYTLESNPNKTKDECVYAKKLRYMESLIILNRVDIISKDIFEKYVSRLAEPIHSDYQQKR